MYNGNMKESGGVKIKKKNHILDFFLYVHSINRAIYKPQHMDVELLLIFNCELFFQQYTFDFIFWF